MKHVILSIERHVSIGVSVCTIMTPFLCLRNVSNKLKIGNELMDLGDKTDGLSYPRFES